MKQNRIREARSARDYRSQEFSNQLCRGRGAHSLSGETLLFSQSAGGSSASPSRQLSINCTTKSGGEYRDEQAET